MLNVLKIAGAFLLTSAIGFQLARWADGLSKPELRRPAPASTQAPQVDSEPNSAPETETSLPKGPTESIVSTFLADTSETGGAVLEKKLSALSPDELEELFIESLSFDLLDRRAFEAAGLALEAIAARNPTQALELLFSVTPAEREKLAADLARGWTQNDALSAWDWIDSAWIDNGGQFIDRGLQNRMFREALEVVLSQRQDIQLAVDLLQTVVEPDLELELADVIAFHVVSENPAHALNRLDFESGDLVDSAIMDAVMSEWAQRDSKGAMDWTLQNERQVSSDGARMIAKDLLLNGVYQDLTTFHGALQSAYKRDAVASESARLLARRSPDDSIIWLAAIESAATQFDAYYDSLYEIGHDDFDSSVNYAEMAHQFASIDRGTALVEALQTWTLVDPERVSVYLNSGDELFESAQFASLRKALREEGI